MSSRERALVTAAFWAAVLAGAGLWLYPAAQSYARLSRDIPVLERQIEQVGAGPGDPATDRIRRDRLAGEIEGLSGRFYRPGEMDVYRFGAEVRDLLRRSGVAIGGYRVVGSAGEPQIEFSVAGDARSLAGFLDAVSRAPRHWPIRYLSVRSSEGGRTVAAVFRIGYAELAGESD